MNKEKYISTADLARILGVTCQAVHKILKNKIGIKIKKVGPGFLYEIKSFPKEIKARIEKEQKEAVEEAVRLGQSSEKDIDFEKELEKSFGKQQTDSGATLMFPSTRILYSVFYF